MKELADLLRDVEAPREGHLVLRGSPNTVAKLMQSAARMAGQFTWRGSPVHGVSVHVVADDDELQSLLAEDYTTRHHYRIAAVGAVRAAGFTLLPAFRHEHHFTVVVEPYTEARVRELIDVLAERVENPYYTGGGGR